MQGTLQQQQLLPMLLQQMMRLALPAGVTAQ
jgi:hypothetical protein